MPSVPIESLTIDLLREKRFENARLACLRESHGHLLDVLQRLLNMSGTTLRDVALRGLELWDSPIWHAVKRSENLVEDAWECLLASRAPKIERVQIGMVRNVDAVVSWILTPAVQGLSFNALLGGMRALPRLASVVASPHRCEGHHPGW